MRSHRFNGLALTLVILSAVKNLLARVLSRSFATFRTRADVLVLWSFATVASPVAGQEAAEWIWAGEGRDGSAQVHLRKEFELNRQPRRAVLRAVVDFTDAKITLNDQSVAVVEDFDPMFKVDVTSTLVVGENVIEVSCGGRDGPSAVALQLDVVSADGTASTAASDNSWQTAKPDGASVKSFGEVARVRWSDPEIDVAIRAVDDYTQWKQAIDAGEGTDPATFLVPDDFEIQLVRSAAAKEDSWVSMAFDPQGRIVVAKEQKGLLRFTLPKRGGGEIQVETINDSLLECRGLLFAHDSLYVNANNSKGLYRLRDTNGDGQFDEEKLLYASGGGVGHGRNDLALGPDGMIYSIHGDAVNQPRDFFDYTSPNREHSRGKQTREGHVIRMDRDGGQKALLTAGLRNPFGIDFNQDGEMFTYDADAEHDMGAPWYRPTRVNHLVPGGDYGWRGVTRQWPPYYPDHALAAPPNLDIGKGSPTAVKFGTKSNFPPKYRGALFVLDWAYGRILAVEMTPRGASYACRAATFLKGRPLNVTDLDFGPDGAMYIVTGGRKTQSALYRVRYTGAVVEPPAKTAQQIARQRHAAQARKLRRELESFHGRKDPAAIDAAWPHMDSGDPWIRHAARIAIEHQPLDQWLRRHREDERTTAALAGSLAWTAIGDSRPVTTPTLVSKMVRSDLSRTQKLALLQTYVTGVESYIEVFPFIKGAVRKQFEPLYPDDSPAVNQELSKLLVMVDSPQVVQKTLNLLRDTTRQSEQLHYLFVLRNAKAGWTPQLRESYFRAFELAREFIGGEGMPYFIRRIKEDALANLADKERASAQAILAAIDKPVDYAEQPQRSLVKKWTVDDLADSLRLVDVSRDPKRGAALFKQAMCIRCHRFGNEGSYIGPDLTSVGRRFSRRDILESIIAPSQVVAEKYQSDVIATADGRVLTGRIVTAGDYRSPTLRIATDPLNPAEIVEIPKTEVESHKRSATSRMPTGLLDTLTKEEILDLLSFIESGGEL